MDLERHRRVEQALWASFGAARVERYVEVGPDGVRHRVQELGDGPPLVFVHGTSVTGTSFAPLAAQLGEHRCLVLDRAGCGFSDRLTVLLAGRRRSLRRSRSGGACPTWCEGRCGAGGRRR